MIGGRPEPSVWLVGWCSPVGGARDVFVLALVLLHTHSCLDWTKDVITTRSEHEDEKTSSAVHDSRGGGVRCASFSLLLLLPLLETARAWKHH